MTDSSGNFFGLKKISYTLFDLVFRWAGRFNGYVFAVSFFSTGLSGAASTLFALYYFDAIDVAVNPVLMNILKVSIAVYWLLIMTQLGFWHFLGFSGIGTHVTVLNRSILTWPNPRFRDDLKENDYIAVYKALMSFPLFNGINLFAWVFVLVNLMIGVSVLVERSFNWELIRAILVVGVIALFICLCFSYVLSEVITGEMREKCKRKMSELGIPFEDKSLFTIRIKLFFFLALFVVNLFLSNTLTYYNSKEIEKVIHFSIIAVIISLLMAHAIFNLIYHALKQIENAAYDLMQGGTGQVFVRSLDREFINVAGGINRAARTILEYQHGLEEKVQQRTHDLHEALEDLKEKERIIETELDFAADIQKGIIPASLEPWNGIRFASYYQPMGKVSGDYYDLFRFPNYLFVLLADVSGHGVPAALITMSAKQSFSAFIEEHLEPDEIFRKVNLDLVEKVKTSDYLTAFMLKIDSKNRITYSNAAHPRAVYYVSSRNEYELLDTGGIFIGSLEEAGDLYENSTMRLHSGDRIYLYTDGLVEHKNRQGQEFGLDRFIECLKRTSEDSLEEQITECVRSLEKFMDGAPVRDDVSMLVLELETSWTRFIEVYNAGIKLLRSRNLTEAQDMLWKAYNIIPSYINLYFHLAFVFYHLNDLVRAEEMIRNFLKEKPKDRAGLQLAINILSKLGRDSEAENYNNVLKEISPDDVKG